MFSLGNLSEFVKVFQMSKPTLPAVYTDGRTQHHSQCDAFCKRFVVGDVSICKESYNVHFCGPLCRHGDTFFCIDTGQERNMTDDGSCLDNPESYRGTDSAMEYSYSGAFNPPSTKSSDLDESLSTQVKTIVTELLYSKGCVLPTAIKRYVPNTIPVTDLVQLDVRCQMLWRAMRNESQEFVKKIRTFETFVILTVYISCCDMDSAPFVDGSGKLIMSSIPFFRAHLPNLMTVTRVGNFTFNKHQFNKKRILYLQMLECCFKCQ